MKYNPDIHHRQSIRLKSYDYSEPGLYFITICAKDRENLFGNIVNSVMRLSHVGKIVRDEWLNTKIIRPNVDLDEFIIMPNHLHGVIEILYKMESNVDIDVGIDCPSAGEAGNQSLQDDESIHKYGRQSNNLFAIIRGFKGAVTKKANILLGLPDGGSIWQSRFYDHIIRNEKSLDKITDYIYNNSVNWESDLENLSFMSNISAKERENTLKKHYNELFRGGLKI